MAILLDTVKFILNSKIPNNESGGEVVLSIGESLLLVLDVCKKAKVDESILVQLNQLYLEGIKTDEDRTFIREIENILADKCFLVKSDPKTINEDPTRRYFETNLAYRILQNNAESLDHAELETFTQNLKKRLLSLPNTSPALSTKVEKILKGEVGEKVLNKYELEYAELTHKLLKNDFYGLSERACKNLYQIACSTIFATLNTQIDQSMPADIYSNSIFTMGMDGRGRLFKLSHKAVRTTAKGLMKSISPLPMYHDLVNPVEENYRQDVYSPLQRSADQSGYMIESEWSQRLFSRQMHPYSNGISSTTLAQIRNMILQRRLGNPHYNGAFQSYITSFASLMLYNSGGHSFFEIFEVFKLPLCQELIEDEISIQEALSKDSLMYALLFENQKEAFEQALQSTQVYMRTLLNKKMLNAEFKKNKEYDSSNLTSVSEKLTLHHAVINLSADQFGEFLKEWNPKTIDVPNNKKWTALMVASQLGKTRHVSKLLAAGADIRKGINGLSSLELAVKNQKFAVVEILLEAGAVVKKSNRFGIDIEKRSPALYLACRQNDMRILKVLLKSENKLNTRDIKEALLTAIKVENLEALQVLINYVDQNGIQNYFSKEYRLSLLKEAVSLGNIQLVECVRGFEIGSSLDIDYHALLDTAAAKGFLPVADYLLKLINSNSQRLEDQANKLSINLDKVLLTALENNHFDMAVFLIIFGANPEAIPTRGFYLKAFDAYLQGAQHPDFLFAKRDMEIISKRAKDITQVLKERKDSVLHGFLTKLVKFLNKLLPNSWRLGYNDKTSIISCISTLFNSKKLLETTVEAPLQSPLDGVSASKAVSF